MFKTLKPAKDGLKVFNPATGLHLKPEGEEISMSTYWQRQIDCGDVMEVEPSSKKIEGTKKDDSQLPKR